MSFLALRVDRKPTSIARYSCYVAHYCLCRARVAPTSDLKYSTMPAAFKRTFRVQSAEQDEAMLAYCATLSDTAFDALERICQCGKIEKISCYNMVVIGCSVYLMKQKCKAAQQEDTSKGVRVATDTRAHTHCAPPSPLNDANTHTLNA